MKPKAAYLTCALAWLVIATSCATPPEPLLPKSPDAPAGVDLSGRWRMQDDYADMQRRIARAIRATDGVDERELLRSATRSSRSGRGRGRQRDVGGLVHVFLENDASLTITQTEDGLFIGFGRSIVEEYLFGEARRVNVGGATARRVSGWEDRAYVIETLGDAGMKLTERYRLTPRGQNLQREIRLRSKELEQVTIVQTFARER